MMPPTATPARRISPATTFLIRAFAPGCPTLLRSWVSSEHRTLKVEVLLGPAPARGGGDARGHRPAALRRVALRHAGSRGGARSFAL
jgi:hypothetical protein